MKFKTDHLILKELFEKPKGKGLYPTVIWDYLNNKKEIRNFYNVRPNLDGIKEVLKERSKFDINKETLVSVLNDQYRDISGKPENIQLLNESNTFTVTTGHQLCLFSGPIYVSLKILSAINLTEELKKQFPEYNFVPVFWMASEDHDFEEINHINLFNKKIEWHRVSGGPVGRMKMGNINDVISELEEIIGADEKHEKIITSISKAYLNGKDLADATRCFIHELFGSYGLVIIDPDHKDLKAMFSKLMIDELEHQTVAGLVNSTLTEYSLTYKPLVKPRTINLFYLEDHHRRKIEGSASTGYKIGERENIDLGTLKKEVLEYPERFSPNVIMRPLYQESILPNIAYIGGPSEIAYWLEFKYLFSHYKTSFPALLVRNSAVILSKSDNWKMKKMIIDFRDLFNEESRLISAYVKIHNSSELNLDIEKKEIETLFNNIFEKLNSNYPSLRNRVFAEKQKAINSLTYLKKKMDKSDRQKYDIEVNQIKGLIEKVFPNGEFQERHESFLSILVQFGAEIIPYLKGSITALDNSIKVITEIKR